MNTKFLLYFLFYFLPLIGFTQGAWTQKTSYPLAGRQYACGFSIGNRGFYAFGCGSGFYNSDNLVEYNPTTNSWTQKASFPGGARISSHVFVIDTLAYFVCSTYWTGGADSYVCYNDVWVYNPYNDSWTQKGDFPGTARHGGFAYTFNGKGYFGLGIDANVVFLKDFWRYNPTTDTWTQRTSCPGKSRKNGFQFSIDKAGYVGMGYDSVLVALNDVWMYDASVDTWTQKANFTHGARCWLSSVSMNSNGYIVTGYLLNTSTATKEFWEYFPGTDTWTALPDFAGIARYTGSGFAVGGNIYNGLGYSSGYLNDFWEYIPSIVNIENVSTDKINLKSYPNPAKGQFTIEVPRLAKSSNNLAILDASMQVVTASQIDGNPQLITVNCSQWKPGKYFVVVVSGQEKYVNSVIVY